MAQEKEESPATNGAPAGKDKPEEQAIAEFVLDLDKLHSLGSEQQEIYLFNYLTTLEEHLSSLEIPQLNAHQQEFKKQLFKALWLASPAPTRAIRNTLGRCLSLLLSRGDRKILFQTITDLGDLMSTGKGDKSARNRHAAAFCMGEVYQAAGDSAIQLSGLACAALLKLSKNSSSQTGVRASVFRALGKIVTMINRSLDEPVVRDIWKQSRTALAADKSYQVQINAAWCLEQLVQRTIHFDNPTDFESFKGTVWKSFDSHSPAVRHATASCLATVLVKAYSEDETRAASAPVQKTSKKTKRQSVAPGKSLEDDENELPARAASPAPKKLPVVLELGLQDILKELASVYVKSSTNNKGRAMITICYEKLFQRLTPGVIENNFSIIAEHFLVGLLNNSYILFHRYRLLLTRRYVQKLFIDVIAGQIFGESGQLSAARILLNDVLKNYPRVLKEKQEPSKNTLTGALDALGSLIKTLGSAFNPLADTCRDTLSQVLQHPSYTVQVHASYCFRFLSAGCPNQLIPSATICLSSLQRELGALQTDRTAARKSVGFANGLAAVLATSGMHPIYSSLEISSKVLSQAMTLLKAAASSELRISGAQVQVAFILIGGLMSLGPNFVKKHLNQLLLTWRNALPKPIPKENVKRQTSEISYLMFIRECALGSILTFLEFNGRLLTTDVSKRIAVMLQNTVEFVDELPAVRADRDPGSGITPSLQFHDLLQMTRRRVLQCLTRIAIYSPHTSGEILAQSTLVSFALECFAEPDFGKISLGTSIATSAGNFETVWDMADNSGFGVSGLIRGFNVKPLPGDKSNSQGEAATWYSRALDDADEVLLSPICGAREHDSVAMMLPEKDEWQDRPDPPATEVVNAAITLFGTALPLQDHKIQESIMQQLLTYLTAKSLVKEPGRRAAIVVNAALALLAAVRVSLGETSATPGSLKVASVRKGIEDILRMLIVDPDHYVRKIAAQALGRLCSSSGNEPTNAVINALVDTIIKNADASSRAGCASALGEIHANVGGMAAGFHLKTIHQVLMSLCNDTHPTVHFWSIEALSQVAEAAGLTFSGYMPPTLGMLAKTWIADSHSADSDNINTSNAETELPSAAAIASSVSSLISVLGPDIQDMTKPRELILALLGQFEVDDSVVVQSKALECWGHLFLYAPSYLDLRKYIQQLQSGLQKYELQDVSAAGLLNIMQKNANGVIAAAPDALDEVVWAQLSDLNDEGTIKKILLSWLDQTSLSRTSYWITRYQTILTKTTNKSDAPAEDKDKAPDEPAVDEEVAGFNAAQSKENDEAQAAGTQELLGWRTRAFALECLGTLFAACAKDLQGNSHSTAGAALQARLPDIIRLAFLASTDSVVALRVRGLQLIDQVLKTFGRTPDPDFSEALLLEQYQAQITSALTPAFSSDSSPELASAAIEVCATFISTGLVKDVERMGRILKLLVSALGSLSDKSDGPAVGDLNAMSTNAQTMVKMAVLSGWAELQVASADQKYLKEVVQPHVVTLTPLWLESLQEFARLRFEPDISNSMESSASDPLDVIYAAFNRQTLLRFYQDTWLIIVDAIASLIDQDSGFVFAALDKKDTKADGDAKIANLDYRDEPVAFFFVLFGIAFEALMTRSESDPSKVQDETLEILQAMRKILRPAVAGNAIYQDNVFSEAVELLGRLALTEGLVVQQAVVDICRNLCLSHPSAGAARVEGQDFSDDIEQLFELTKIIVQALKGVLPNIGDARGTDRFDASPEATALVLSSMNALADIAKVFPEIIRGDLHACIINTFTTILGTGACQERIVPRALPIFKRFVLSVVEDVEEIPDVADQIRNCLKRFRMILAVAQRRETEASLPCARNTLIAATMILTSGAEILPVRDELVFRTLDDMLDCIADVGLGKTAANCLRSLLMVENKSETGQAIAAYIMPRLLRFLLDDRQKDPEGSRNVSIQAMSAYAGTVDPDQALALLCVLVPGILQRARLDGKESYPVAAARLLNLAGGNPSAFKGIMAALDLEQRAYMEEVMREGGLGAKKAVRNDAASLEPTIALKFSFGA